MADENGTDAENLKGQLAEALQSAQSQRLQDAPRATAEDFMVRDPDTGERAVREAVTPVLGKKIQFRVMRWGELMAVPAEHRDGQIREWPAEAKAAVIDGCIAGELGDAMRERAPDGKITAKFLKDEMRYTAVDDLVVTIVKESGRPPEVPDFQTPEEMREGKAGRSGQPASATESSSETSTTSDTPTSAPAASTS